MGKSAYHKSENTFKFQSFSERIANVNIDVIHRVKHHDDNLEESGTYFGEALDHWTELNCTLDFTAFRKEISDNVQTFNQLVHHKETIVEALQRHLQIPNSLALEPLLDLLVQLARDLQKDFYPYFRQFFDLLVSLLENHPQDSDLLERLFSSFSYLFKFLWRYLARDIKDVYGFFSALLSQQYKEYIRNFAAESFAYLMRKVKNHGDLFDFMFSNLQDNPDMAEGVGRLLFEMVKGVQKQFHSCLGKVFPLVLSKAGICQQTKDVVQLPWEQVHVAMTQMFASMAIHTNRQHSGEMWKVLLSSISLVYEECAKATKKRKPKMAEHLLSLLKLMNDWLTYRHGYVISIPDEIANCLLSVLKGDILPTDTGQVLLTVVSSLLQYSHSLLSVGSTVKLVSAVFKTKYSHIMIYDFTKSLLDLPLFEKDVLPALLPYSGSVMSQKNESGKYQTLQLYTEILQKKAPSPDVCQMEDLSAYVLDFGTNKSGLADFILNLLSEADFKVDSGDKLTDIWSGVICLPHISPLPDKDGAVECVRNLLHKVKSFVETQDNTLMRDPLLNLLYHCFLALLHMQEDSEIFTLVPLDCVKDLMRLYSDNVSILKLSVLYFNKALLDGSTEYLTEDVLLDLYPYLENNISSHRSKIRLLTLRILSQFDLRLPSMEDEDPDRRDVFSVCLDAELVPLTVHEYRRKLMFLQKLDFDIVHNSLPIGPFMLVPLQYLLGTLFLNFKLIWEPIRLLIGSHAKGLDRKVFWDIYFQKLTMAAQKSEEHLCLDESTNEMKEEMDIDNSSHDNLLLQQTTAENKEDKVDFVNFRYQLWKAMQLFPDKCEPKSKDLVPLLFNFLRNEYYPADLQVAPTQNIQRLGKTLTVNSDDVVKIRTTETGDDEPESTDMSQTGRRLRSGRRLGTDKVSKAEKDPSVVEIESKREATQVKESSMESGQDNNMNSKKRRRAATSALLVHLELFSMIKNPKSLYMESDLYHLYHELLIHKSSDVQKVAFACVMTYKHKYLIPYRENFERLLDEKTFRNEIVLFSIDNESSVVDSEHRADLLPVLMRVLYGKMQKKPGTDSHAQRSIILRFLNGCHGNEILQFMEMVFEPFKYFITENPVNMVQQTMDSIDITRVIPLRKISGALHMVDIIMKKLGHLVEGYLSSLLQILLGLTATCISCLEKRERISYSAINTLKSLRQFAIARITQFFEEFDNYSFTADEIDAIFNVAVWPQLAKLPFEGLYHPTVLLKLLLTWTKNKRYFILLGKRESDSSSTTALNYILKLLNAKGVNARVINCIMEILDNLLNPREEDMDDVTMGTPIKINNATETDESEVTGTLLIKPHISSILEFIKNSIAENRLILKKKNTGLKELAILSRISEFAADQAQCSLLVELLIPFLGQGVSRSLEMEKNILSSLVNLVSILNDTNKFYMPVSKMFGYIHVRPSRIILCQLLQVITEKNEQLKSVAGLVSELNSWDKKRVEEPDYLARLSAFKKTIEVLKNMDEHFEFDYLVPIIYNVCYFIKMLDDMSLRDNATHFLVTMVKNLQGFTDNQNIFRKLITQGLLPEVKLGVRSKTENVRHEFFAVLSALVETFPTDPMFSDLVPLKDKDVEADFFENIRHIQTHRRSRALRKVVKLCSSGSVRKETLVSYFLPLTSSFLLDDTYNKAQGLHDSAIDTLGVLCQQLPWQLYLHQLKYYLYLLPKKLEKQKLLVRTIVAILDAFHFDLRNTRFNANILPASVTQKKAQGVPAEEEEEFESQEKANSDSKEIVNEEEPTEVEAENIPDTEDATVVEEEAEVEASQEEQSSGKMVCSTGLATKIHVTIIKSIIPELNKCLTEKAKSDLEHKLAKSKYAEDVEILRVPIALAMVKLLQNLPHKALEQSLPGILLKVCNYLKSRAKDIRTTARDTLVKILTSLGPRFFPYILSELRGTLRKGYQVHVLCFTVFVLLRHLSESIKPGDLDVCRQSLQDVFHEDLFGQVSEEKEVDSITGKLFEAKTVKSYDSYQILARFIGKEAIVPMMGPIKQVLDTTHSHKISGKVQDILRKVSVGLLENAGISTEDMMIFIHSLVSQSSPLLNTEQKEKQKNNKSETVGFRPPSCLLLPDEQRRGGAKPKTSKKTNIHVLVEFGLHLLNMLLKRSRVVATQKEHLQMADPLIPILTECLFSRHIRINSVSLRCLCWLLKFHVPSLKTNISRLSDGMFILLKNYASAGAAKGDNLELVSMAFKAVTVLVRDVQFYTIDNSQLQVLLTFCEEDLQDYSRQSTAFTLLKAILLRRLNIPEVHELLLKVESMSITADSPHVRRECRQIALQYILDYPLGKKLVTHMEFFVTQLTYDLETGRESSLEMLATMFASFPQNILMKHAGFFFVPLSVALVNDESSKCRKLTALAIKSLLQKIDHNTRNDLFSIVLKWFTDLKLKHRSLAAQLTGLFVEVESAKFEHHLSKVLPIIQKEIEPSLYEEKKGRTQTLELDVDHLLFNCLNTLMKIIRECDIIRQSKWRQDMNVIWDHIQNHLLYPHTWIRLASAQLFGLLFASWTPDEIVEAVDTESEQDDYLTEDASKKIEELVVIFTSQLQSEYLGEEFANQVIKNMVFVAKVVKKLTVSDTSREQGEDKEDDEDDFTDETKEKKQKRLSLPWVIRKMIREANQEAISHPKVIIKRSSVFKWIAAVSLDLEPELLSNVIRIMMPPIQRETEDHNTTIDPNLKTLAQEVLDILKKRVDVETFTRVYAEVQRRRAQNRDSRKRQRAVEAVSNPDIAAKRRMKKNLAKQESKKRKMEGFRVSKKIKKSRLKDSSSFE